MICDSVAARYYNALGLSFLWDDGIYPLLDAVPHDINAHAFWAAGKLYALSAMPAPCVMIDTDFIVWKPLAELLTNCDAAAIHREDISSDIYPDSQALGCTHGFDFSAFDWSIRPLNTALAFFGCDVFRRYYTDTAITFMRNTPDADDMLTYMVFAEQRLLAMCAEKQQVRVTALSDLPSLFDGTQQGYFTHTWGFKQQMREDSSLSDGFCELCAARLCTDFPADAAQIAAIPLLTKYF